jgi:phosphatidylserine/phosphatidylglycerophosphate/cardiolipin synthase-like enzyme
MWDQSINIDILVDKLLAELLVSEDGSTAIRLIQMELPSLTDSDAVKVCQLVNSLIKRQSKDTVEIVTTTPISFLAKTRKTRPVIEELISGAEHTITLTGYSISDHFEEFLKLINQKSKRGVVVELFVNSYEKVRSVLSDIEHTSRRFLKVYEYSSKTDDKMAALHAKTIIVDGERMLISSANLSYHGLEGNIEIGALITSKRKAAQVQAVFSDLKHQKIFVLINDV